MWVLPGNFFIESSSTPSANQITKPVGNCYRAHWYPLFPYDIVYYRKY